jgi:hypothetical protein
MKQSEVQKELDRFSKSVIKEARKNLTTLKKNHTKGLWESLKGNVKSMPNSLSIDFEMNLYGQFQDKGVKGVGGVRETTSKFKSTNNKGKMWKQNAPQSEFKFKIGKKPSVKHFMQWSASKGLNPYAVRDTVYHQGIKPSLFFTKPFEAAFKRLPDELIEKFGLDAMNLFKQTQFKNEKK